MTGRSTIAALFVAAAFALSACTGSSSPGSSGGGSGAAALSSDTTGTSPLPTVLASLPNQSDTAWGRIWDDVPDSFPEPTGAEPATDTGQGPVSERLVITGAATDVTDDYVTALHGGGWTTNKDGPLEDGSFTVEASSAGGCKAKVTITSIGDASLVAILYGASCPFA
jgi:hypothetical protein